MKQSILSVLNVVFCLSIAVSAQEEVPKVEQVGEAEKEVEWKVLAQARDQDADKTADSFLNIVSAEGWSPEDMIMFSRYKKLISGKAEELTAQDLLKLKKVRSIQFSGHGIFSYPYFNCRFKLDDSVLFFEKTTGSQRKSGLLFETGKSSFVFLGGSTVNAEAQRQYSGVQGLKPGEHDTTGVFIKRGKSVLAVFDRGRFGFEIYEFK
ncbi:MAG: DUF4893 domain-containing protein [Akkermansiaceae bacterium]